ncbi:bifunctional riboflavin kinase/FAD synthetase [Propionispira raffinosivorans]|uniref:bifunctional riboflavin kinase/FAD synthetase n=1 Tax=Propionispira raffinosivorans TaxID=86959 RepID=UPI00036AE5C0|nr:bifunctional riboflavin kinase/FAD synthetase [Propionispira raffinosivorans]
MQIFSTITNLTKEYSNIVVALGTFDGVHLGHQNIIKQAIRLAKSIQGTSVVFTFSNHPLGVISPKKCPLQISDNICKETAMRDLGIDVLMNVPFTKELVTVTPLEFLQLLQDNLAPKYVVVGPNYTFGYKGEGNPKLLLKRSQDFGFISEIHPVVHLNNQIISSTKIRHLLLEGQLDAANMLMGRPFRLCSKVVHGDERGRLLGFPTANLAIENHRVMLPNGIYVVHVFFREKTYRGIANIGTNPTFDGVKRHIEVHILEFKQDIYDQLITIEFVQKIRDEEKFSSVDQLVKQIKLDIKQATTIFNLH